MCSCWSAVTQFQVLTLTPKNVFPLVACPRSVVLFDDMCKIITGLVECIDLFICFLSQLLFRFYSENISVFKTIFPKMYLIISY